MDNKQSLSRMALRRNENIRRRPQESKPGGLYDLRASWNRRTFLNIILSSIIISHLSFTFVTASKCSQGIITPGVTYPAGDISLLYGDSLDIWCILDRDNVNEEVNSKFLTFYNGSEPFDQAFITTVNESTIKLHVEKPLPSDTMYYCKLPAKAVCLNKVVVGTVPQKVDNFSCLSLNWQNLTCKWKPPHNFLKTTYALTYKLPTGRGFMYDCPNMTIDQSDGFYSCFWDQSTSPHYRQAHENYTFELMVSNKFGNLTQEEYFHHYARVRPSPPIDLQKVNKTVNSVFLTWKIPSPMQNFPPGLLHKIIYQSEYDGPDNWKRADFNDTPLKNSTLYYNLTNLEYAYTWYDVRVYLKSGKATEDDLWSDFAALPFRTLGMPPKDPPQTPIGSFEVVASRSSRDIYLYWKQIEKYNRNGENFTYKIVSIDVDGRRNISIAPHEISQTYAKFKGVTLQSLNFTIVSSNVEGDSKTKSFIYVPNQYELVSEPLAFTKIAFGNGLYELSWRYPDLEPPVDTYTIFWCDNDRDRPFQCEGRLNSTTVNGSVTILNVTMSDDRIFQFAISANRGSHSSGMIWASCTAIPNKIVGKMKTVWVNKIDSFSIELRWKLDCSERVGIIEGYIVFYCPIDSPTNGSCKIPEQNITIPGNSSTVGGTIMGLKPYTTYRLQVAVVTKHGVGMLSDPLRNTTMEAAPSQPLNIVISELCNKEMLVSWDPPENSNGVIREYFLNYNNQVIQLDKTDVRINGSKRMEHFLTNLTSYTNYTITVQACTQLCSPPSKAITVRTAIGKPGLMDQPSLHMKNLSSEQILAWKAPYYPGGNLDIYQVQFIQTLKQMNDTQTYNMTDLEFVIPDAICNREGITSYQYSVRAVNYDIDEYHGAAVFTDPNSAKLTKRRDNGTTKFEGPWSPPAVTSCGGPLPNPVLYWVFGAVMIIVLCILCMFGSKRLWNQYKTMQDIGVSLPPGLESISEKETTKYPLGNWGSQIKHNKDDKSFSPSADEVSLLPNKMSIHAERSARDLSAFSVNTDSTNLSLDSTRVPSDSCKDKPILQDSTQSDSHSANSSVRLRNSSSGASRPASLASSEQNSWNTPYKKINSTHGDSIAPYTIIGTWAGDDYLLDVKKKTDNEVPSKGYVSFGTFNGDSYPKNLPIETTPSNMDFEAIKTITNFNGYISVPPTTLRNHATPLSPVNLVNDLKPDDKSISYIKANPENLVRLPLPLSKPSSTLSPGYVRVDELPVNSQIPSKHLSPAIIPHVSAYVKPADPALTVDIINDSPLDDTEQFYEPAPKGYVTLQDPHLTKQTNIMPHVILSQDNIMKTNTVSTPDGYCRFGWDRNEDPNFDSISAAKDIGSLSIANMISADTEEDFDSLIEDNEFVDDVRAVNPSYLPLNLSPIRR